MRRAPASSSFVEIAAQVGAGWRFWLSDGIATRRTRCALKGAAVEVTFPHGRWRPCRRIVLLRRWFIESPLFVRAISVLLTRWASAAISKSAPLCLSPSRGIVLDVPQAGASGRMIVSHIRDVVRAALPLLRRGPAVTIVELTTCVFIVRRNDMQTPLQVDFQGVPKTRRSRTRSRTCRAARAAIRPRHELPCVAACPRRPSSERRPLRSEHPACTAERP